MEAKSAVRCIDAIQKDACRAQPGRALRIPRLTTSTSLPGISTSSIHEFTDGINAAFRSRRFTV